MNFFARSFVILSMIEGTVHAAPFLNDPVFAVSRGGTTGHVESTEISVDDYHRAEKAIFDAVEKLESKVQTAIEKEVDTLFRDLEHHEKESVKQQAKERVQKSAKKVRQKVEDHDHAVKTTLPSTYDLHPFPYAWPKEDPEHRILHAVEAAEKAVIRAVEEEVNTIFQEIKHEDDSSNSKNENNNKHVKKVLKRSVEKMDKDVDANHERRRQIVLGPGSKEFALEDYLRCEMESME